MKKVDFWVDFYAFVSPVILKIWNSMPLWKLLKFHSENYSIKEINLSIIELDCLLFIDLNNILHCTLKVSYSLIIENLDRCKLI